MAPPTLSGRLPAALLLLLASACAGTSQYASTPPPGAPVVEAPDYAKQGGTWVFRIVHNMHTGGYRTDMDYGDAEVRIRNGKYQRMYLVDGKRTPPKQRGTWLYGALPTTRILEAKNQYFKFPLWVGKRWSGAELNGTRWRDTHCTVTGIETVTTPAGTFETYRIERLMWFFVGIENLYDTEVYYYSPQTRSVVKYEYKREIKDLVSDPKYGLQETASFELLSYKPEPESKEVKSARAE